MGKESGRYRRQISRDGTTVFVRRRSLRDAFTKTKTRELPSIAIPVPVPEKLLEAYGPRLLPETLYIRVGDGDEMIERAYKRLAGLDLVQIQEVLQHLLLRVLHERHDDHQDHSRRVFNAWLDRQLGYVGLTIAPEPETRVAEE